MTGPSMPPQGPPPGWHPPPQGPPPGWQPPPPQKPPTPKWAIIAASTLAVIFVGLVITLIVQAVNRSSGSPTHTAAATPSPTAEPTITPPTSDPPTPAPTTDPPSAPEPSEPPTVPAGEVITVTTADGGKGSVVVNTVRTATTGGGQFPEPPKNGLFVIASVTCKTSVGAVACNPYRFQLQLQDGTTFETNGGNAFLAGADPTLELSTLSAGQQETGNIVWDANASHGTIVEKNYDGTIVASWTY